MTRGIPLIVLAAAVFAALTQQSAAQSFSVSYTRGNVPPCNGTTTVFGPYSSGTDVEISLAQCATRVNIYATSTTVNIGRVTLTDGPVDGPLDVVLGTGCAKFSLVAEHAR